VLRSRSSACLQSQRPSCQAVKALIADQSGLAATKQKISTPALGFLKDTLTLAYYNIALGGTLQLGLKERGGRKK